MDQTKIDALRAQPVAAFNHLIDGKHVPASDGGRMDIISPIDGTVLTTTASGTAADMEAAIAAARAAFEDGRWSGQPPAARKKVLMKWADLIEKNALELAVLGVRDNGTEIGMALKAEPGSAASTIRYYAEALDKIYGEVAPTPGDILGMIHKEPVGVVGAIIPWNFPMMIGAWKLGPALAMGNSVVLKPCGIRVPVVDAHGGTGVRGGLAARRAERRDRRGPRGGRNAWAVDGCGCSWCSPALVRRGGG